jgi:DNA mismatch endonuclease (patch repair protein)
MERNLKAILGRNGFLGVSKKRSQIMSAIKGRNNQSTEAVLKMALIRKRVSGWKQNVKEIPGKPDFYFHDKKIAIFVDGCFWHYCPVCGHLPKTRNDFWKAKLERNRERDKEKDLQLLSLGIKVIHIWEHQLKKDNGLRLVVNLIQNSISK